MRDYILILSYGLIAYAMGIGIGYITWGLPA